MARGFERAAEFAEEQNRQTVQWFLRPAAGLEFVEEVEERLAQERVEEIERMTAEVAARRREAAERGDPIARDIQRALAASAAMPAARWEQGRYQPEPEPEPEPMEPVWLQEAASSSACAAA